MTALLEALQRGAHMGLSIGSNSSRSGPSPAFVAGLTHRWSTRSFHCSSRCPCAGAASALASTPPPPSNCFPSKSFGRIRPHQKEFPHHRLGRVTPGLYHSRCHHQQHNHDQVVIVDSPSSCDRSTNSCAHSSSRALANARYPSALRAAVSTAASAIQQRTFSSSTTRFRPGPHSASPTLRRSDNNSRTISIMAEDPKWPALKVRETFLKFFEERSHTIVPSSSVCPVDDKSLLFTNAGMNQFKPIFLGTVAQSSPLYPLRCAVDSQKCIRAGGKHNDLDDVGKDSYHHTFFEMLGNWSFGDYFKKEAIGYAWELLTKVYGLDPERIYATYFEGDESQGLKPDLEAKELWRSIGIPEERILSGDSKDNFWEMGDQGPCGPCSELHYDIRGGRNAASLVNQDDPEVIEIWNLVFIQYNREADRNLRPLPAKHIDTGLGFERLVSILQSKRSNYDTDVFYPLFNRIQEITGARTYTDKYGPDDADGIDTAYRVCADHIRLLAHSITDGGVPGPEGRGYVIRRVLRRGVRYARKYFNADIGEFFSRLLPALVEQMGHQFPALREREKDIQEILDEEEEAFARTLDRGEAQFGKYAANLQKNGETKLAGADVWKLYDTFGFPVDLTALMCEERGLTFSEDEVSKAQETAREASKAVKQGVQQFAKLSVHHIAELGERNIPRTNDEAKFARGNHKTKVQLVFDGKTFINTTEGISEDTPLGLVLDSTSFYAEAGGQVGDTGIITIDDKAEFRVLDTQSYGGYVLHNGHMVYGTLSAGDEVLSAYDELVRAPIRSNHTGTHVLNHSLRETLGDHVDQKGSVVDAAKLRFDFSHKAALTLEEIQKIEDMSNDYIRKDVKVVGADVELEKARGIDTLRAVFGETYPNPVRVVSIGASVEELLADPKNPEWRKVSVEFCGGTHVDRTGLIKELTVIEEGGISKGIRRITAFTGEAAHQVQREAEELSKQLAAIEGLAYGPDTEKEVKAFGVTLSTSIISTITKDALKKRHEKVVKANLDLQKKAQKVEAKAALDAVQKHFADKPDSKVYVGRLPISANAKAIAEVIKSVQKEKEKSVYLFAGGEEHGAVCHGVFVGKHHAEKGVTAEAWADAVSDVVGGKSGGKEPSRQGQGTKPESTDDGVATATKWLDEKLKL